MKEFNYPLKEKILFYLSYFFYKSILPFEVKKPRLKMFIYEIVYSLNKFKNYEENLPYFFNDKLIITKFGKFKIRPKTSDAASVSPAYERRDLNFLIKKIKEHIDNKKKVLFLDIGADLGYYSIVIGNLFRDKNIKIIAFEPVDENYSLLNHNIKLNKLEGIVETMNIALLNKDNETITINFNIKSPGTSSAKYETGEVKKINVKTKTLDSLLGDKINEFDSVFLKIDVEGSEKEVLEGGKEKFFKKSDYYLIMLEDFINPEIISYMKEINSHFLCKLTTYNSFWEIKK